MMSRIALFFVRLYGLKPWWVVRIDIQIAAFLLTYVYGYRRKVIRQNLKLVGANGVSEFGIYKNLSSLAFESFKLHSASIESVASRVSYENLNVLHQLFAKGRNVVLVGGHMANWEMFSLSLPKNVEFKTYAVYKKLNNHIFNKAIRNSRSRAGMKIVGINDLRSIIRDDSDKPKLISIVFDQRPLKSQTSIWTEFLGVETPVYSGIEKIASMLDASVVFAAIRRQKDSRYVMNLRLVEESVSQNGEVIDKCLGMLEEEIVKEPESWLWTHRRWKHKRPDKIKLHERRIGKFEGWR
ncbi:MAG: hypothetical protein CL850_03910 [Crocinitomicaceae bacterium]|nr:hypothetical protein [Crocinitomicaceae bacterium]